MNENDKPDVHSLIILGQKLKNPYSVSSMQAAFDYYNQNVVNSPFEGKKVKATHNYIKIFPTTEDHLIALDELDNSDEVTSPILHDYPLDYEILEEGDYYVEPADENDLYHPAYTVIPVGYQLPNNLPFEIIEPLYYPEDEKEYDVETVALFFADWNEDLEADDIVLTAETLPRYLNESLQEQSSNRLFGRRYRPNGYVKVENTDNNVFDPLQKAKISIGRSFWWKNTYTNDVGYFNSPKKYRGKVRIRAKWRGYTATIRKTWNELLGLWVSDHLMTLKRSTNGRTKNIGYTEPHNGIFGVDLQGGHLWFKGTVHNGLRKYIVYCNTEGIDKTISYANVWAFARDGASSTPMLYRYPQLPTIAAFANIGQANVWQNITAGITASSISLVPYWLRPDQIYQGLRDKKVNDTGSSNTVRVHQLVFHESGHYSHARKAGALFWAENFAAVVSNGIATWGATNDPYRNGSYPSYQAAARIGLVEGWATLTEFKVTTFHYERAYMSANGFNDQFFNATLSPTGNTVERFMENFDVFDRPMTVQRWDDRSWFLHGILWDLLDNHTENIAAGGVQSSHRSGNGAILNDIVDNVFIGSANQFNLSAIFNSLLSNVHNACDLRSAITTGNGVIDAPINQLFISYGYNCGVALP